MLSRESSATLMSAVSAFLYMQPRFQDELAVEARGVRPIARIGSAIPHFGFTDAPSIIAFTRRSSRLLASFPRPSHAGRACAASRAAQLAKSAERPPGASGTLPSPHENTLYHHASLDRF